MRKNLVLVKFDQCQSKCYLFEIPQGCAVAAGDILLVVNSNGKEEEVTAVCDSFHVYLEKDLVDVCRINGTRPCELKRAIALVEKDVRYFKYDDETAEDVNKPWPKEDEEDDEDFFDFLKSVFLERDDEKQAEAEDKEALRKVAEECAYKLKAAYEAQGVDIDGVKITILKDKEDE